jgi:hypothetical protein
MSDSMKYSFERVVSTEYSSEEIVDIVAIDENCSSDNEDNLFAVTAKNTNDFSSLNDFVVIDHEDDQKMMLIKKVFA